MIAWPADLVRDVARRRAVLVLGAGVSMNSTNAGGRRPKDWAGFLTLALSRMSGPRALVNATRKLIRDGDFLTACDVIRTKLGRNAFCDLVREEFLDPHYQPAKIHEHIEALDTRVVLTPNFDKIYDSHVAARQNASLIVKTYRDSSLSEATRLSQRTIIKIHGTVDTPMEMIFTREDYAKARSSFRSCYEVLSALILTHTFIFLGCGLSDPDTALLLEDYAFRHENSRHHYLVTGSGSFTRSEIRNVFERTRGIMFLEYNPKNHHQELTTSLEDLVTQVTAERQDLATTQNW